MSKFTKLDTMLISEAYSAQLLVESAPHMTIAEIQSRIPHMTIAEAQVIEELFGKLGQKLGQVGSGVGNLTSSAVKGLKTAGQSAMGAVDKGIEKASQIGSGLASAAGQVGKNVQDIYKTGEVSKQTQDAISNASKAAMNLIDLVQQAQQNGLVKAQKDVSDMSLAEIMDELETANVSASTFKQNADKTGYTGGVGAAFKKGFQNKGPQSAGTPSGVPQPS
jgi:ABC-type transporter Mla subunit MlaD